MPHLLQAFLAKYLEQFGKLVRERSYPWNGKSFFVSGSPLPEQAVKLVLERSNHAALSF
jgi:hypothetical protein